MQDQPQPAQDVYQQTKGIYFYWPEEDRILVANQDISVSTQTLYATHSETGEKARVVRSTATFTDIMDRTVHRVPVDLLDQMDTRYIDTTVRKRNKKGAA
ncbi:MAG: hypothetical protein CMB80_00985 [Flammeovirgaceae bacterium]|nr:hypothetical protein [Flammeovirgaceae bacterium]|tara:strand:- start:1587 stop:1886 length:300 start_codon:yes stop_codon:yes gene_type:complete